MSGASTDAAQEVSDARTHWKNTD